MYPRIGSFDNKVMSGQQGLLGLTHFHVRRYTVAFQYSSLL